MINSYIFVGVIILAPVVGLFSEELLIGARLEMDERNITSGNKVSVNLIVTNNSQKNIELTPDRWPRFFFTSKSALVRSDGEKINFTYIGEKLDAKISLPEEGSVVVGSVASVIVKPKSEYKYEMNIDGIYDLTKPGKYTLSVPGFEYYQGEKRGSMDSVSEITFTVY